MLEDSGFEEMTKQVIVMAERHAAGRVVSVLEGGYNLDTLGETVRTRISTLLSQIAEAPVPHAPKGG